MSQDRSTDQIRTGCNIRQLSRLVNDLLAAKHRGGRRIGELQTSLEGKGIPSFINRFVQRRRRHVEAGDNGTNQACIKLSEAWFGDQASHATEKDLKPWITGSLEARCGLVAVLV